MFSYIYIFLIILFIKKGCAMMIDSCESRLCSWIKINCHTAVMIIWCQMQGSSLVEFD